MRSRPLPHLAVTVVAALGAAAAAVTHAQLPDLVLEEVVSGLDSPVALTHTGDERLFVTLQSGRIVIVRDGVVTGPPFLDIASSVGSSGNEQGLFSLAFHPDYAGNGLFFVDYTDNSGDTVIARYRISADPDRADPASARVLLQIPQPYSNHNGGQLQFGPDGMLYAGMGDGGSANDPQCNAQRQSTLLGKLLRLDVDRNVDQAPYYAIPEDNPFVGQGTFREEVWALGLRNPWRFSFDAASGDLFVADVGQGSREEVDRQPFSSLGGENYGWKMLEGTLCLGSSDGCSGPLPPCGDPGYTPPILDYGHDGGNCSVTGGYVYRGSSIPALAGTYLYGDYCSGRIWAATGGGSSWSPLLLPFRVAELTSFGEDRDGELYLLTRSGTVYRLAAASSPLPGTIGLAQDLVSVAEGAGSVQLTVRRTGGTDGVVSVVAETAGDSAASGLDFAATVETLEWGDGDAGPRIVSIPIVDDDEPEGTERFRVLLGSPSGGALLGRSETEVEITDDDGPTGPCVDTTETLCLGDGRFRVVARWRSATAAGNGQAERLTRDTGTFWFFDDANVEIIVKVLDACSQQPPRFWVFGAGLTSVEVELDIVDTKTGRLNRYRNPLDTPFAPIQDTDAFASCP